MHKYRFTGTRQYGSSGSPSATIVPVKLTVLATRHSIVSNIQHTGNFGPQQVDTLTITHGAP